MIRRRSKYGAKPTVVDGMRFASKREAHRWQELRLLEKAGEISELARQVAYPLVARVENSNGFGVTVGHYIADFVYRQKGDAVLVIEDSKGFRTDLYKWKAKHFAIQYCRQILET